MYGPLSSNGCFSASTVLALSKYATISPTSCYFIPLRSNILLSTTHTQNRDISFETWKLVDKETIEHVRLQINFGTPFSGNTSVCRPEHPLTSRLSVRILIQTLVVKKINKTDVIGFLPSFMSSFSTAVLNLVLS
jgi:hypothetical protein